MKPKSRITLIREAITEWLQTPKMNRATVACEVVEAVERLNLLPILETQGIAFAKSEDPYNDNRKNAQKLFRWLGDYTECPESPERLFYIEQAIVAALPAEIRLSYLEKLYSGTDVLFSINDYDGDGDGNELNTVNMAAHLLKEQSEAALAVVELSSQVDRPRIDTAIKEVGEAIATGQQVLQRLLSIQMDISRKVVNL